MKAVIYTDNFVPIQILEIPDYSTFPCKMFWALLPQEIDPLEPNERVVEYGMIEKVEIHVEQLCRKGKYHYIFIVKGEDALKVVDLDPSYLIGQIQRSAVKK